MYVRNRLCVPLHVSEQGENAVHSDNSQCVQLLSFLVRQPSLHVYVWQGFWTLLSPLIKVLLMLEERHGHSLRVIHWPLGPITLFPGQIQPGTHLSGFWHWLSHVKDSQDVSQSLAHEL